jgi:hypothetical protein
MLCPIQDSSRTTGTAMALLSALSFPLVAECKTLTQMLFHFSSPLLWRSTTTAESPPILFYGRSVDMNHEGVKIIEDMLLGRLEIYGIFLFLLLKFWK